MPRKKKLQHVGFYPDRLKHSERETAFAKAWKHENTVPGKTQLLMQLIPDATERDAQVAATIIQWLGTNVGMCFLHDVVRDTPSVKDQLRI